MLTGADFELELWLVGRHVSIALLFQAKKFIKQYDCYVRRLKYPNGTRDQLKKLLAYAASNRRVPFYAIYTTFSASRVDCPVRRKTPNGPYMVPATVIEHVLAQKVSRLSLDELLARSKPLYCMFCCPSSFVRHSFNMLGKASSDLEAQYDSRELPNYVQQILYGESELRLENMPEQLRTVRAIGVYDMRNVSDRQG